MIPVLTRAQMRAFDKYAIETCHVPGVVLMENAGRGAADVLSAMIEESRHRVRRGPSDALLSARARAFPVRHVQSPGQPATYPLDARVVVVCGTGNNGGDGFVVARHLYARGAEVEVYLAGKSEKVMGDARINHDAYIDLGGRFFELPEGASLDPLGDALSRADFVIDALFGTGLDRPISGHLAEVIVVLNGASCRAVALDIPSGLDADSGSPLGIAVRADETVTFGHLKIGMLTPEGARLSGNVHVVDLGVPDPPILAHVGFVAEVIRRETVGSYFVEREANVHKHKAGDVLIVAGSRGKLGASLLTAGAAMRAGAGLVTICTWAEAATSLESRVVEVMTARIDPDRIGASLDAALVGRRTVAIGPGFGLGPDAREAVDHVVLGWDGVKVVDADAITHFVGRAEALAGAKGQLVLTPHPGELGRLLGRSAAAIEEDRFGAVREAVERTRAVVILKGARTIIATPEGRLYICMAGNPALATAGAGDVLTGLIAAFACTMPAVEAACAGVFVHALAGDLWSAHTGCDRGLFAGEIPEQVPEIIAALMRGEDPLG
jgi:ADP-dependent NAD(P)H-hydrate dehydratase / NAD(P)H-hydrate epimerase